MGFWNLFFEIMFGPCSWSFGMLLMLGVSSLESCWGGWSSIMWSWMELAFDFGDSGISVGGSYIARVSRFWSVGNFATVDFSSCNLIWLLEFFKWVDVTGIYYYSESVCSIISSHVWCSCTSIFAEVWIFYDLNSEISALPSASSKWRATFIRWTIS